MIDLKATKGRRQCYTFAQGVKLKIRAGMRVTACVLLISVSGLSFVQTLVALNRVSFTDNDGFRFHFQIHKYRYYRTLNET